MTLPEGRKPITDKDLADLTRKLADTAIDWQARAEAAEARVKSLEAQLREQALQILALEGQASDAYEAQKRTEAQLATARAVNVKPLKWSEDDNRPRFLQSKCGSYQIYFTGDKGRTHLTFGAGTLDAKRQWQFQSDVLGEEAMRFAQKHHEEMILAFIDTAAKLRGEGEAKAQDSERLQDVVQSAAAQLVSCDLIAGAHYVRTPLMYATGDYVVVRVESAGEDYLVSDFGAGHEEASLMGGSRIYMKVARDVAEANGVAFNNYSLFVLKVSREQLPGAIATVANSSQEAVNITSLNVSETKTGRARHER